MINVPGGGVRKVSHRDLLRKLQLREEHKTLMSAFLRFRSHGSSNILFIKLYWRIKCTGFNFATKVILIDYTVQLSERGNKTLYTIKPQEKLAGTEKYRKPQILRLSNDVNKGFGRFRS